jgi:hypothetical protein
MITKFCVLVLISIFSIQVPAFAISTSLVWEDTSGTVSSSGAYQIDASTSFDSRSIMASGTLSKESQAIGLGKNILEDLISGDGYTIENGLASSGSLCASFSAVASAKAATLAQNTKISGDIGLVISSADSKENSMTVAGGFSGSKGNLNAQTTSTTADRAFIGGRASILGIDCVNDGMSKDLASGNVLMRVNGLFPGQNGKFGYLGFVATNGKKGLMPSESQASSQISNDPNSYTLEGWRWKDNPDIQFFLKTDGNLQSTGLTVEQVSGAVYNAESTWDDVTSQKLFKNGVICSPSLSTDKFDNKNVIAWIKNPDSNALAYTRTWYSPTEKVSGYNGGSYNKVLESDITFNTASDWTTDGRSYPDYSNTYDVQTTILHELGHTIGLGDIYNSKYFEDMAQIMNAYKGLQRTLGAGDINGVRQLYGP